MSGKGSACAAAPKAWSGKAENVATGQAAFTHRTRMNSLAALGGWNNWLLTARKMAL